MKQPYNYIHCMLTIFILYFNTLYLRNKLILSNNIQH